MTILIQDGRRGGHLKWARDAATRSGTGGIIMSAFSTPRFPQPHHKDASAVVNAFGIDYESYEILFDPMTHARLMPGTDKLDQYHTWDLWGSDGVGLDTMPRRLQHVERVFSRQAELQVPKLAPTLSLNSPASTEAGWAIETARIARGLDPACYQSLVGSKDFFSSGPDLDAHVGRLAALRATNWVVTIVPDVVPNPIQDLAYATNALVGWMRTIHSLSARGRVIVQQADLLGLLAVAAGAQAVGTGWDRGMRVFDAQSFQNSSGGIRRPASCVTQKRMLAVLRRAAADDIERLNDHARAAAMRGGPMPADEAQERWHHLSSLNNLVSRVKGSDRAQSVGELKELYDSAAADFDWLERQIPGLVAKSDRESWVELPRLALETYAKAEDIW